jgi:hypothetical protein
MPCAGFRRPPVTSRCACTVDVGPLGKSFTFTTPQTGVVDLDAVVDAPVQRHHIPQ